MNKSRRSPFLLSIMLALSCSGGAQNALTRFYAPELGVIPGEVVVSPGGLSVLEFWGVVDDVMTGDPMLLTVNAQGNTVYLGTTLSGGMVDLVVVVSGQQHLFHIRIESGSSGPRRYVVEERRPRPSLEDPLKPRAPSDLSTLALELLAASPVSGGGSSVFFTFTNGGRSVVALDSARLTFEQNGASLPTRVTKTPKTQLVEPGAVHSGYVVVEGAEPGLGRLRWTVTELIGAGKEVTFDENVALPAH